MTLNIGQNLRKSRKCKAKKVQIGTNFKRNINIWFKMANLLTKNYIHYIYFNVNMVSITTERFFTTNVAGSLNLLGLDHCENENTSVILQACFMYTSYIHIMMQYNLQELQLKWNIQLHITNITKKKLQKIISFKHSLVSL